MATRLRLFVTLFCVLGILKLVHMAPQRYNVDREQSVEYPEQNHKDLKDNIIDAGLKIVKEGLKEVFTPENTKKIINKASQAASDILHSLKNKFIGKRSIKEAKNYE